MRKRPRHESASMRQTPSSSDSSLTSMIFTLSFESSMSINNCSSSRRCHEASKRDPASKAAPGLRGLVRVGSTDLAPGDLRLDDSACRKRHPIARQGCGVGRDEMTHAIPSFEMPIQQADRALQIEKKTGRNRICHSSCPRNRHGPVSDTPNA